ncbi:MAG: cysteine synthase [Planctomyces sp.]|nr:cysteine synthase [Planctomyces sp.]
MLSPLNTPLVSVSLGGDTPIYAKLEYLQPSGSTKDRLSFFILGKAMRNGSLKRGQCVIEASSGSTSISLAMVCAHLGLEFIAVMPEGVSQERIKSISAYGAQIVLTPSSEGILGSLKMCQKLAPERQGFLPRQFENFDNARAHQTQTAQEIAHELGTECIDAFVSGVGTGGTLVGNYLGLRDFGCNVSAVLAKPVSRQWISDVECCSFSERIPGVVDGLSTIYREAKIDNLIEIEVDDTLAMETTRKLIQRGFPVGPSSGLNFAAGQLLRQQYPHLKTIVTIFPDRMDRYFSTPLFSGDSIISR